MEEQQVFAARTGILSTPHERQPPRRSGPAGFRYFTVRLADLPFAAAAQLPVAACLISVAPLGVGFAGMLLGSRRAPHDLLADTRVVRAQ